MNQSYSQNDGQEGASVGVDSQEGDIACLEREQEHRGREKEAASQQFELKVALYIGSPRAEKGGSVRDSHQ